MPDPRIPEDTILRTSELANAVEDMREAAAQEAKDLWADFREELKALGLKGSEISAEVSQFKAAIADKRMNSEDRAKADAKSEGKDGYLAIINSPRARARTRGSEPLLTKAAGQAVTAQEPVVASPVESEAAEISTPIQSEPDDAAVTAGDVLREPAAAEQGQNIREGDAPRETDRFGGDASRPDTEHQEQSPVAPDQHVGANTADGLAGPAYVRDGGVANTKPAPLSFADRIKKLRPLCQQPDRCRSSGGKNHCFVCRQAADTNGAVA